MKKSLAIILLVLISTVSFGQRKASARPFVKGGFQLPNGISNYSFKKLMSGVSDVNLSLNFPIGQKMHLGVVAEHSYFSFDDLAIPEKTNASLQITGASLNFGATFPTSEKFSWEVGLSGGYQFLLTSSETCNQATGSKFDVKNAVNIRPNLAAVVKSTDYLSFSLLFSYNVILSEFGPDDLCISQFSGFTPPDYVGNFQVFAVGFGFKVLIPEPGTNRDR